MQNFKKILDILKYVGNIKDNFMLFQSVKYFNLLKFDFLKVGQGMSGRCNGWMDVGLLGSQSKTEYLMAI